MKQRVDYSKMPEADVIRSSIISRFRKGLGTNIFIIGLSGTGKSSTSIRLGELVKSDFKEQLKRDVQVSIVDSLIELLESVRSSSLGNIIIVEEVSVLFPSRRAMSKENVAIARILDTIRKKQITLISNAPLLNSIDSHMKAMGHILVETIRINKTYGVVVSKTLRLQTNPRSGKTYTHRFQRDNREVHRIITRKPTEDAWKEYESKKDKFMNDLYEQLKFESDMKKKKEEKQRKVIVDGTTVRKLSPQEVRVHQLVNVKGMKKTDVARELQVDPSRITRICQNINKKLQITKENQEIDNKKPSEGASK